MVKPYNETDFRAINLFIENNWIVDKQINTTTIKLTFMSISQQIRQVN